MEMLASEVPSAVVVPAAALAPAQGKQDEAATTLQSQRENVGASVAGPASEAASAAAVPATALAPAQGKHDKAAATLRSQPEKAPRRKCLLNEHTTTSLSRDQVQTIKRAIRAASTEEEVEKLEKAILDGVMPRGLRSQAGCVAAKAAHRLPVKPLRQRRARKGLIRYTQIRAGASARALIVPEPQ